MSESEDIVSRVTELTIEAASTDDKDDLRRLTEEFGKMQTLLERKLCETVRMRLHSLARLREFEDVLVLLDYLLAIPSPHSGAAGAATLLARFTEDLPLEVVETLRSLLGHDEFTVCANAELLHYLRGHVEDDELLLSPTVQQILRDFLDLSRDAVGAFDPGDLEAFSSAFLTYVAHLQELRRPE